MSMMEIKGICKSFGKAQVLKDIDINVEKGDVIAILGPSGSGKTTLLRCINFLEKPDKGMMEFDGVSYDFEHIKRKDIAKIRKKTAFVFQSYNLFANKTALENVTLGLTTARKIGKKDADEIGLKMLEKVGLKDYKDHYPIQLSGGQQQRVAIARALAGRPSVILADEPTGNLDSKTSQDVMSLFRITADKFSQTIVMITHNTEIAQTADRIIRIEDGLIVNR